MVRPKKQFKVGDFVFAKVRGYPAWPAVITNYKNGIYNVVFGGTGDEGHIKRENLFKYNEKTKKKFSTARRLKDEAFREGIEEIEAALKYVDPTPLDMINVALNDAIGDNDTADDIQADEKGEVTNNYVAADDEQMEMEESTNTSEIVEEMYEEIVSSEVDSGKVEKSQPKDFQNVTCNGRTITPQHYFSQEYEYVTTDHVEHVISKEGIDSRATVSDVESSENVDSYMLPAGIVSNQMEHKVDNNPLTLIPSNNCVAIKLNYNKPEFYASPGKRPAFQKGIKYIETALKDVDPSPIGLPNIALNDASRGDGTADDIQADNRLASINTCAIVDDEQMEVEESVNSSGIVEEVYEEIVSSEVDNEKSQPKDFQNVTSNGRTITPVNFFSQDEYVTVDHAEHVISKEGLPNIALNDASRGDGTADDIQDDNRLAPINTCASADDEQMEVEESVNTSGIVEEVYEENVRGEVYNEKGQSEDFQNVTSNGRTITPVNFFSQNEYVTVDHAEHVISKEDVESSENGDTCMPAAAIAPNPMKHKFDNVLLTLIPPNNCVAIKLNYNKPESYASATERVEWEAAALVEANKLKELLEIGEINPESVMDRLILNVPICELDPDMNANIMTEISEIKNEISIERNFLTHSKNVSLCLGKDGADTGKCLEILDSLKDLQLSQLMLLRNPDCVDIIRRLCRYVGNIQEWNLCSEEEEQFRTHAEIIRQKATVIFNNFVRLCNCNGLEQFFDEYIKQVSEFINVTQNLSPQHRISLTERVYEKLLAIKK